MLTFYIFLRRKLLWGAIWSAQMHVLLRFLAPHYSTYHELYMCSGCLWPISPGTCTHDHLEYNGLGSSSIWSTTTTTAAVDNYTTQICRLFISSQKKKKKHIFLRAILTICFMVSKEAACGDESIVWRWCRFETKKKKKKKKLTIKKKKRGPRLRKLPYLLDSDTRGSISFSYSKLIRSCHSLGVVFYLFLCHCTTCFGTSWYRYSICQVPGVSWGFFLIFFLQNRR